MCHSSRFPSPAKQIMLEMGGSKVPAVFPDFRVKGLNYTRLNGKHGVE